MSNCHFPDKRETLSNLKDELYALNRRMLLAMQIHDETAQEEIKHQIEVIQEIY